MQATVLHYDATEGERFRPGFERRIIHTRDLMTVVLDIGNGPWDAPDPFHACIRCIEQVTRTYLAEGEILFLAQDQEPRRMKAGGCICRSVLGSAVHSIQLLSRRARLVGTFASTRFARTFCSTSQDSR